MVGRKLARDYIKRIRAAEDDIATDENHLGKPGDQRSYLRLIDCALTIDTIHTSISFARPRSGQDTLRIPVILGIGYFFNPIDLIPDSIPLIGYLDDFCIVALGFRATTALVAAPLIREFQSAADARFQNIYG